MKTMLHQDEQVTHSYLVSALERGWPKYKSKKPESSQKGDWRKSDDIFGHGLDPGYSMTSLNNSIGAVNLLVI